MIMMLRFSAYEAEGDSIVDEYAHIARNYAKEVYSLKDVFERLLPDGYVFEISKNGDSDSRRIYSRVFKSLLCYYFFTRRNYL